MVDRNIKPHIRSTDSRSLQQLWERWRDLRSAIARGALLEATRPLVIHTARRFRRWHPDWRLEHDDLVQESLLGLARSMEGYRPGRASFATWAGICAWRDMLNYRQYRFHMARHVPVTISLDALLQEGIDGAHRAADLRRSRLRRSARHGCATRSARVWTWISI